MVSLIGCVMWFFNFLGVRLGVFIEIRICVGVMFGNVLIDNCW